MNLDGTYTIVISPSDPDVWNWVSTGGLNQGTISIRFQDLGNSSTLPTVSSQVVKLDDLPSVLPAGTKYATTQDRLDLESRDLTIASLPIRSRSQSLHRQLQIFAAADENARQPRPDIDRVDSRGAVKHRA
jgi:hypothetical protein